MLPLLQFTAVLASSFFAGAAIYINLVEHPARLGCSTELAATQWAPSYKRATIMQASLAVISFLSGVGAWFFGAGSLWLIAAIIIFAVVPVSLLIIMPVNDRLLAQGRDLASSETRSLLIKWGNLHAIRSVLGSTASVLFIFQLVGPQPVN
jgi:cell division protein FtsL